MNILAALVILSVVAGVSLSEQVTCQHSIHCPCGSTNKNVTVCTQKKRKDDPCSRWSKCKTCQDGLNRCLECPEGLRGPLCATETGRARLYRQKRQFYSQPSRGERPRRPYNPFQSSPNQANSYPTRPVQRGGDFCPDLNSPKLGSIRCLTNEQQRTCVGRCLPGYSFEDRGSENEITLTCTEGYYTPLREFPPCKSGGYCDLIVQGAGSFNCTTGMTGTQCDVICDSYYIGRYSCYPGQEWQPPLPYCMRPKDVEEEQTCHCDYGGSCDRNGHCVCPVGRTGRFCETILSEKQICSDPGYVTNGFRRNRDESDASIRRMFDEGEVVVYGCESEEYALQGSSILMCKNDGTWSKPRPKCIRTIATPDPILTFCQDPGVDPNGSRIPRLPPNPRGFPQGTQLEYSCNQGYDLEGEKSMFCLSSGEWMSKRPKCNAQSREPDTSLTFCRDPGVDPNGSRNPTSPSSRRGFPQGTRLEYFCNQGYDLEGESSNFCLASGEWFSERPRCNSQSEPAVELVYCLNPGSISNGQTVYYPPLNNQQRTEPQTTLDDPEYPQGGRVEYSCDIGYTLEGSGILTCQSYGDWSADRPVCRRDIQMPYCLNPGSISNGRVVYYPPLNNRRRVQPQATLNDPEYPQEGRLQYFCNSGYTLEGSDSLTCQANGYWSAEPPVCRGSTSSERIRYCNKPGPILNGRVVYIPTLNERRRPRPPDPDDDTEEYPQGSRLQYSCDNGYTLDGTSSLTCAVSGRWSADPPTCKTTDVGNEYCKNPGPILNGRIQYHFPSGRTGTGSRNLVSEDTSEFPKGTTLDYVCDDGYIAEGTVFATCQSSGRWTARQPKCNSDCGRSIMQTTRKILHGNKTDTGDWPWVVAIATQENSFTGQVICGGAILNTQTIITAAHCLPRGRKFTLYFGKYYRSTRLDDPHVQNRTSDRVIMHPGYRNDTFDSDIALITFKPKIKYSDRIQPVCLPTGETTARNLYSKRRGYVTGWGYTEKSLESPEMLMAHLPVLTNAACLKSFRENVPNFNPVITQNMFCAGFSDARQSTCTGDSGSPMVFSDTSDQTVRYILEGLVSFGVQGQCGQNGTYTVFTKINRFLPWIYTHI